MCFDVNLEDRKIGETSSPGVISSGGLGPCIAIGVYDKKRKRGYMMHESNANENEEVPLFLDYVLKKSKKENLAIYVAGGGLNPLEDPNDPENINESIFESRNYVKAELEARFEMDHITIDWNYSLNTIELILDTSNGDFLVEFSEHDG